MSYETLNQVQGDEKTIATQPLRGEDKGEGALGIWSLELIWSLGFGDWNLFYCDRILRRTENEN